MQHGKVCDSHIMPFALWNVWEGMHRVWIANDELISREEFIRFMSKYSGVREYTSKKVTQIPAELFKILFSSPRHHRFHYLSLFLLSQHIWPVWIYFIILTFIVFLVKFIHPSGIFSNYLVHFHLSTLICVWSFPHGPGNRMCLSLLTP